MKNKIPWWEPKIEDESKKLALEVLESTYLNDGEVTRALEGKIRSLVGCTHVIGVSSGTAALFLALKGLGVGQGDEVIIPDLTYIATANAVTLCGAKPVLVDVDAALTMSADAFAEAITDKTKAVIPVHVSGRGADMHAITMIAHKHGISVVEDAAEAFMSKHKEKYLGTYGDAGCFSLSPFKIITSGQGGLIATDSDNLHHSLRLLKNQGLFSVGTGGDDVHETIGYNFKLTNLQAAVALGQLPSLQKRISRMRHVHTIYKEQLQGVEGITLLPCREEELQLWVDALAERRSELVRYLHSLDIGCRAFWLPLHTERPYRLPDHDFPNSTRLAPMAIWLPSAFTLSDEDITFVCDHIKRFYQKR